jgi:predicted translin family RNA/ssDNA-binding protein
MKTHIKLVLFIEYMLDKKDFLEIRKDLIKFEESREKVIVDARDIIKLSKQIIYSLNRDDIVSADKFVKEIKTKKEKLIVNSCDTGIHGVALQEYVEALCYYHFFKFKKIPTRKELKVNSEEYLLGLCDLTGELVRKAVNDVINGKGNNAVEIYNLVEEIYGEFLQFDLRNGELRKKFDSIKWNLNKLQELVLSLKLRV